MTGAWSNEHPHGAVLEHLEPRLLLSGDDASSGLGGDLLPSASSAEFWVYVDQPGEGGDRDVIEHAGDEWDVGHAWWQFRVDAGLLDDVPADLLAYVNTPMGFYPANGVGLTNWTDDGAVVLPDNGHFPEVQYGWDLSPAGLLDGLEYARQLQESPPIYDLADFNCTDAAIACGAEAGVAVPDTSGSFLLLFQGSNPGDLGEDLVSLGANRVAGEFAGLSGDLIEVDLSAGGVGGTFGPVELPSDVAGVTRQTNSRHEVTLTQLSSGEPIGKLIFTDSWEGVRQKIMGTGSGFALELPVVGPELALV